jgi:hypothetical protein
MSAAGGGAGSGQSLLEEVGAVRKLLELGGHELDVRGVLVRATVRLGFGELVVVVSGALPAWLLCALVAL